MKGGDKLPEQWSSNESNQLLENREGVVPT